MKHAHRIFLAAVAMAALLAWGCLPVATDMVQGAGDELSKIKLNNDLKTHSVRGIKTITIDRIAVMPLIEAAPDKAEGIAAGGTDAITAQLYSQSALSGGWEVVPQDDVLAAMQKFPPSTPSNLDDNALRLGHDVSADGVLYGVVARYQERVGADYAADKPASVNFSLKFVDVKSQQVVWTANFSKTQRALSENMFDFANFVQRSGRWIRANELSREGVEEAVADLHGDLNLQKNVKHFETGSYGQLKSGGQRFNTGSSGIY